MEPVHTSPTDLPEGYPVFGDGAGVAIGSASEEGSVERHGVGSSFADDGPTSAPGTPGSVDEPIRGADFAAYNHDPFVPGDDPAVESTGEQDPCGTCDTVAYAADLRVAFRGVSWPIFPDPIT